MQFFTIAFFALMSIVFIAIKLCNTFIKSKNTRIITANAVLLAASYAFIIYADFRFALAIAALTIMTWLFAKKEKLIPLGIVLAVVSLGFFKYTNFFIESFSKLFGNDFTALNLIIPIGVSFYTFSAISYLVDVKRGKVKADNLLYVALYLSSFPKLTSGPIQRSGDFFEQAHSDRAIGFDSFKTGIQIFVFGLFKKIVLADRLSVFVNQVYATPKAFGSLTVLLAVIAYSFQIYFDFSGYSDMAIGVAKILGFNLPRNFNLPYLAHNVTELWKRWHISLSSWLMEYLYFPLGGSRKGTFESYLNLVLTMVIGGIWHGANWTYVFWGLLHGLALVVHKLWMKLTKSDKKKPTLAGSIISIILTFAFTSFCWIFFRANSFENAIDIITRVFSFSTGLEQPYLWLFISLALYFAAVIFAIVKSRKSEKKLKKLNVSRVDGFYPFLNLSKFWQLTIFFVFVGLTLAFAYTGGSPFIYGNY